jgi:predicted enzyme related to lactoylglutathione lyase
VAINYLFAGVPVADFGSALPWYERLFGRPPELIPNDEEAAWQLAGDGWVYVVADPDRAGNGLLTLIVDDLDAELAGLARRGLSTGPIDTIPGAVRKATIVDPDGNRVTFGEPLAAEG